MEGKRSVALTGDWDTRISRRMLLRTGGSAAAGLLLLGRTAPAGAVPPFAGADPFSLGIASGDPTPDGFVLWTRLLPEGSPLDGSAMKPEPYGVRYEIAADPDFREIVRRGTQAAMPLELHTVHVELAGLQPDRWYWYRFKWGTSVSAVGRTRTAPAFGAPVEKLRFAVASCQNYPVGYYAAYADLARQDLDLVVHLGDYIYEGVTPQTATVAERAAALQPAHECRSLSDYRIRHALYKTDPQLQEAHRLFPWLPTWDDHEVEDNYADLVMNPEVPLEEATERRAAAYLAYWEHQPLSYSRKPVHADMNLYRRAQWGALATFHVLDTRQYRDDQVGPPQCPAAERDPESSYCFTQIDPNRQILGAEQRDWLLDGLTRRPQEPAWHVLANQVGFAPEDVGTGTQSRRFGFDSWDGYAADRQRVLDHMAAQQLKNVVVLTGDKHINSVRHVPPSLESFDGEPVATEFIGTSITSGHDGNGDRPADPRNPHHLWTNNRRGYVAVELDAGTWRATFRTVDSVRSPDAPARTAATWTVENGDPRAIRETPVAV